MRNDEIFIELLKGHKRWADRYSILSIGLILALSVGAVVVGQIGEASPQTVTQMIVVVCAIVIAVTIWQAAAMLAARMDLRRAQSEKGDGAS